MKLVLVTAVWRRHTITRAFWCFVRHLHGWWDTVDLHVIAVGSQDPEHERMARAAGAEYVDAPNAPLGRKYNRMLEAARAYDPDAICVMGSDDVFCEAVARAYLLCFEHNELHVGLKDLYFYDCVDGRFGYWPGYHQPGRKGEPAGCGRVIPREYLERLDWSLWNPGKHRGVDHSSFKRMRELGMGFPPLITVKDVDGCAVDLKSRENLWQFEYVRPATDVRAEDVLPKLPADLLDLIAPLRKASRVAA